MRIGIDISQIVHEGTGVGVYVKHLVGALLKMDEENEYVLFGASLRKLPRLTEYFEEVRVVNPRVRLAAFPIPPTLLEFLWNWLHIMPIEWFVGEIDVFWSSDWIQPPLVHARGITTIHDVGFLRYPETFAKTIVDVQKRRLAWVKQECKAILCDSEATRKDASELLNIRDSRLQVVYPGYV